MPDERLDTPDEISISVEATERKSEQTVVDFENYGIVCNHFNNGSRRRGILSEKSYQEIINDQTTVFVNSGGSRIPVLMDVNHGLAMGYDVKRCREYAQELSSDIRILTLPPHELSEDEKEEFTDYIKSQGKCAMYFSDHCGDESSALTKMFDEAGIRHKEKPLVDSRASKGDEQAALYLYALSAEIVGDKGERKKYNLRDIFDYYDKNVGPLRTFEGRVSTTLDMGDRISDQQAEEMWDIYNERFEFLGDGHPISMQDSKEDFLRLLRSDRTMVALTYSQEENSRDGLTCFSYYVDDFENLYWLNQKYLYNKFPASEYFTNIFTPGVVSSGKGASYSSLPIGLFIKVCDESGVSANMLFENTNLSKRYIPKLLDKTMNRICENLSFKQSEIVDECTYRLWSIGGADE